MLVEVMRTESTNTKCEVQCKPHVVLRGGVPGVGNGGWGRAWVGRWRKCPAAEDKAIGLLLLCHIALRSSSLFRKVSCQTVQPVQCSWDFLAACSLRILRSSNEVKHIHKVGKHP